MLKIVFGMVKLEIGYLFTFNINISTRVIHTSCIVYVHHNRLNVRKLFLFCVPCPYLVPFFR